MDVDQDFTPSSPKIEEVESIEHLDDESNSIHEGEVFTFNNMQINDS
jgi:hypothetical protein